MTAIAAILGATGSAIVSALVAAVIVGIVAYVLILVLARLGLALPVWIAGVLALVAFLIGLVG